MLRSARSGLARSGLTWGQCQARVYGRPRLSAPPQAALQQHQFTWGRKSATPLGITAATAVSSSCPLNIGKEAPCLCSALAPGPSPNTSRSARFKWPSSSVARPHPN
ncbi:hypothetical protein NDU88_007234 [Pleurodeles waltl]|uniref:Uncharacterized protein n=1 Tax=Pleurodeles waltl TaxID=8319 RepID=A0AAV7SS12_PLEWA|nr:hypothetical protein NDU88_007234 [Pleurodeles waltl]